MEIQPQTDDDGFLFSPEGKGQGETDPGGYNRAEEPAQYLTAMRAGASGRETNRGFPVSLSRRDPQRLFTELGLLSSSGKPRLNAAQGFFNRAENQENDDLLEQLYVYWRDLSEFLVLRSLRVNPRTWSSEWSYVGVKSSKRGNDVYISRVKRRLNWLSNMENVTFFSPSDFQAGGKKVYSSALWLTLTYDAKRCSRAAALERIGQEWNRFLASLRSKYGHVSVLRSWETSEKGYPHVHACLLFQEARFQVFPWISENDQKEAHLTYRIEEKDQISSLWHSHVDIQAISSTRKLFNYMRKYQTKTLMSSDSPKGTRTMAFLWLHRKRSFSVSGDFRAALSDLIRLLHNSRRELRQTRLDGSIEASTVWEFCGVFSGEELDHHGERWTFRLNKAQIETVLSREAEFKVSERFRDYD